MSDVLEERDTVITLARTLRVAAATVSRAPRGDPRSSEKTRRRVGTLAATRGFRLMLLLHAGNGPIEDQTAQVCAGHGVPVIMVNRAPRAHASAVACDNFHGGQELASLLLCSGHRSFAIVRGNLDSSSSVERERGFADRLQSCGVEVDVLVDGGSTYDGGFAAGRMFAEMPPERRPEAIFALADIMATGIMDALRIAGLSSPDDSSVTGFDSIAQRAWPTYAVTSIRQPTAALVTRGLDLLTARIERPDLLHELVLLRGELMIRRSGRLSIPEVA